MSLLVHIVRNEDVFSVATSLDREATADAFKEAREGYAPYEEKEDLDAWEAGAFWEHDKAAVSIPVEAAEIEVTTRSVVHGELVEDRLCFDISQIREAIQQADKYFIPSDATFVLTEKGKAYAEELLKNRGC